MQIPLMIEVNANMIGRKLFEAHVRTREGEREYDKHRITIAETAEQAAKKVYDYYSDFWGGEEAKPDENGTLWFNGGSIAIDILVVREVSLEKFLAERLEELTLAI